MPSCTTPTLTPRRSYTATHPRRVAPSEVVVDGEDVRAASGEGGEKRRRDGGQRLSLAGRHLGDGSAVEREPAEDLHVVEAQAERAASRLAHEREAIDHSIVFAARAELERAALQILIGERLELRFALADGGDELAIVWGHAAAILAGRRMIPRCPRHSYGRRSRASWREPRPAGTSSNPWSLRRPPSRLDANCVVASIRSWVIGWVAKNCSILPGLR